MSLETKIMAQMKTAMKNKDQATLRTLRAVKSAILLAKTEKGNTGEISEEQETKMLQKLLKQRKDSLVIYEQQGREDLATTEKEEIDILSQFLPAMMNEEAIKLKISELVATTGAAGMQDMGKVMGQASQVFAGKADMSLVSKLVREALA